MKRALDVQYVAASTRNEIHECAVWMSEKEHAVNYAKAIAQRNGWSYEVFEVRKIGIAEPTDAKYEAVEVSL